MKHDQLDLLVKYSVLTSYEYVDVDPYGNVGQKNSRGRNTQRLILKFANFEDVLQIDTFCTGNNEDSVLEICASIK